MPTEISASIAARSLLSSFATLLAREKHWSTCWGVLGLWSTVGGRRGIFICIKFPIISGFQNSHFLKRKVFFQNILHSIGFQYCIIPIVGAVQFSNPSGVWLVTWSILLGFVYEIRFAKESFWLIDPTCRGHICSDSRCTPFDTRLLLFFSHVVFMLHVAWELHVTLRYNNNMHTTAALLYVGSKSSTTQTQRERRAWVQSTGSVRKSSGVATYMIGGLSQYQRYVRL